MACKTCQHWSPKKAGQMAKHHFALCAQGKPWEFKSPEHQCLKHKPAAEDVTAARIVWLKRSSK